MLPSDGIGVEIVGIFTGYEQGAWIFMNNQNINVSLPSITPTPVPSFEPESSLIPLCHPHRLHDNDLTPAPLFHVVSPPLSPAPNPIPVPTPSSTAPTSFSFSQFMDPHCPARKTYLYVGVSE